MTVQQRGGEQVPADRPLMDVRAFEPGVQRGDHEAVLACAEVAVAFCELLDAGDAAAAFALHSPDLAFYPPGATGPLGITDARRGAEKMLNAYDGRRTLHVVSNFLARATSDTRVLAQYVVSVYELTREVDGVGEERRMPELFAFAHERAIFERVAQGAWRYREQRMIPIAPTNPFGERTP